jgi:protein-S-isoprenylcysteine O-methyltransferase Ste14
MKVSTAVNAHKALVIPVVAGMMARFDNWSTEAFVYLALHGTYSLLWLLKHALYPDRRFAEERPAWMVVLFAFVPLLGYFVAPYLLISRHLALPPWLVGLAIALFVLGVFLHYVSDAQKHYTLRLRPGLITGGLFARTRNPNYLGEMLIYTAYALLARHWLPFVVLAGWWTFFARNMLAKDRSLARHADFADYRARSGLLLPRLRRPSGPGQ